MWSLMCLPSDKPRCTFLSFPCCLVIWIWIKNNVTSEQEGSKKLVRSGAEKKISDFVFLQHLIFRWPFQVGFISPILNHQKS